jgi:hypothetical protein
MTIGENLIMWVKGQFEIQLVFQVVDDPGDYPEDLGYLKPVDVWYIAVRNNINVASLTESDFLNKGKSRINITKTTDRDLRTAVITTDKNGGYLYVLARPTTEWQARFIERRYEIKIETGKKYNIAVSLKPKKQQPLTKNPQLVSGQNS